MEEIEVSFEVAEAYMQILKYERCSKRRDRDKLKSLEKLAEKGFDPPAENTDYFENSGKTAAGTQRTATGTAKQRKT